jgi:hypothetical protein
MKKFNLASLLALFMFGMLLAGCGNDNDRPLPPSTVYCSNNNDCGSNQYCSKQNNCEWKSAIKEADASTEKSPEKDSTDGGPDQEPDGKKDCEDGASRSCYTGKPQQAGVGSCTKGTQVCADGKWEKCQNQVLPQKEVCGDGKDNDCDGTIDNGCAECKKGDSRTCYTGQKDTKNIGICKNGTQACENGKWSRCRNEVTPQTEICDGKDNNCDGRTDEGCQKGCTPGTTQDCYSGTAGTKNIGTCRAGKQTCDSNGNWGACNNQILPTVETCDGKDNDCDGQTDENIAPKQCYTGPANTRNIGSCKDGVQQCVGGRWSVCMTETKPSKEICDRQDNDCDGTVDEGFNFGASCSVGTGSCKRTGVFICSLSGTEICNATAGTPSKEVCNGKDDDCDGNIDEDNVCNSGGCNPGASRKCGSKVGACSQGTQFCKANGSWSTCSGETKPSTEICDGKDNDCDGQTDEDFTNLSQSCSAGAGSCARTGRFVCKSDGSSVVCDAQPAPAGTETCNGKDDDCDGLVDEGLSKCLEVSLVQTKNQTVKVGDQSRTDVKLTYNFHMSTSLVTQDQFKTIMGYLPTQPKSCGNCPVVNITAHEAMALANKLSKAANVSECYTCSGSGSSITCSRKGTLSNYYTCTGYRLPSEVEWELAARCGQKTYQQYICTPLSSCAHFGNMNGSIQPVRQKAKSSCGLYDMLGNTYVITDEGWDRSKVFRGTNPRSNDQQNNTIRGCSYQSSTANCSTGKRHVWLSKTGKRRDTSVRFVRTIP